MKNIHRDIPVNRDRSEWNKFETKAVLERLKAGEQHEHSTPIYLTSGFLFDSPEHARALFQGEVEGNIYSRYGNPNTEEFINKLCNLERCEDGIATATGMAAIFATLATFLQQGDHIVASRELFGSTHQIIGAILSKWGVQNSYVNLDEPDGFKRAMRPNTRLLFVESPSNPGLTVLDIGVLGRLARDHEALLIVDNCMATPYLQKPGGLGAHIVLHSGTKFIDGQGRVLGGAILGEAQLIAKVRFLCRHIGASMSPFNAWLLSKSLETLAVRMDRHSSNALRLAEFLQTHPAVVQVRYPFLPSHPNNRLARRQMLTGGGIVSFEVVDGMEGAIRFMKALRLVSISANLGDARSIVTHPASTTHSNLPPEAQEAAGITPGLVRMSVGLEHIEEILDDVATALESGSE